MLTIGTTGKQTKHKHNSKTMHIAQSSLLLYYMCVRTKRERAQFNFLMERSIRKVFRFEFRWIKKR